MDIKKDQNSQSSINLLAAQRQIYTEAKRLYFIRLTGALLLASLSPIIFLYWPETKFSIALVSGFWLLIARLLFKRIESQKIKQAATIQEEFDVQVLNLPWNKVLVGKRIIPEIISSAVRRFSGDRKDLENWYSIPEGLPSTHVILLCQRSSLIWDGRLRQVYAWSITLITTGLIGFGFILAILTNQTVPDYLLALLLPALSALITGIEEATENFKIAAEKEDIEKKIQDFWETALEDQKSILMEDCRKVQDYLFFLRSKSPLVPDRLYKLLKPVYEVDMKTAASEMAAQATGGDRVNQVDD